MKCSRQNISVCFFQKSTVKMYDRTSPKPLHTLKLHKSSTSIIQLDQPIHQDCRHLPSSIGTATPNLTLSLSPPALLHGPAANRHPIGATSGPSTTTAGPTRSQQALISPLTNHQQQTKSPYSNGDPCLLVSPPCFSRIGLHHRHNPKSTDWTPFQQPSRLMQTSS